METIVIHFFEPRKDKTRVVISLAGPISPAGRRRGEEICNMIIDDEAYAELRNALKILFRPGSEWAGVEIGDQKWAGPVAVAEPSITEPKV